MQRLILLALLVLLCGCGSNPIKFYEVLPEKHGNKYCILVKGRNSTYTGERCSNDELNARSVAIHDPYINNDVSQTMELALSKGYIPYFATSPKELENIIANIARKSNDTTQLLIALSGEGDERGFNFNLVHTKAGNLVPPGMKLTSKDFIDLLRPVKGAKAVVINSCQSGCFVEAARRDTEFKGVVIAACAVGYATTPCQRTGTSAVFAGFLGLYQDDPKAIKNLATESIGAGHWWENFRRQISDIGAGGLDISYSPVIYSTADFLF